MSGQGYRNFLYSIGHNKSLPYEWSVAASNNDAIWNRFRYITTFTVYVTLRSTWFSKRQLKLQATCAFRFMCKDIVG